MAVATVGGIGFAPLAPGTITSALVAIVLWLVPVSPGAVLLAAAAVTFFGTAAAHVAERALGDKDPGAIVVDEVAGMLVSVLLAPSNPGVLVAGFVLFRVFDVTKPFPAGAAQRLSGGLGVMMDDLVAGLYALGVLALGKATLGWP